ncbi:MAG: hypothetical protein C4533_06610 [Candidatus Omnitrophota bacterium]|jgi:cytochrome c biogenesis protein CcdA|nr:MAG: hypothetical protein C4533_06610 [Candidatus Omnitrophota bacterium]
MIFTAVYSAAKYMAKLFIFLFLLTYLYPGNISAAKAPSPELIVFHSPSCHKCLQFKKDSLPDIQKRFDGRIKFSLIDITGIDNYKFFLSLKDKYGKGKEKETNSLPVIFFNGEFVAADQELGLYLDSALSKIDKEKRPIETYTPVNLVQRFMSFSPIAIMSAGLIDGINPCAFTVIVFFISFLALQGYRKRHLAAIGLAFILAVFVTYVLIGLGLFGFLYKINDFYVITRVLNVSIGLFCFVIGFLSIRDIYIYKRSGKFDSVSLKLPDTVKRRIQNVIGMSFRNKQAQGFKLIITALATGFIISIFEAVCTGQVYLPTITFVLKTTDLKLRAFIYLLLYNIMFIVPLVAVFILSLFGATHVSFSKFINRYFISIKIIIAFLLFTFGILLVRGI